MNVFRLVGDMSHLLAILILLMKMWKSRSVAGTLNLAIQVFILYPERLNSVAGSASCKTAYIFVSNFCRLFLFSLSQRTVLKSNMQQSFFNCPCKAVIADFHHRFTLLLARRNVIQYNNSQF